MEIVSIHDVDEPTEAFIPVDEDDSSIRGGAQDVFESDSIQVLDVLAPKFSYARVAPEITGVKEGLSKWLSAEKTHEFSEYTVRKDAWNDVLISVSPRVGGMVPSASGQEFRTMFSLPHVSGSGSWKVANRDDVGARSEYVLTRPDGAAIVVGAPKDTRLDLNADTAYTNMDQLLSEHGRLRKVRVSFRPTEDVEPIDIPISLPLLRLHCPHFAGCSAELTVKSTREEQRTLSLDFPGVGLKGKQRLTVQYATSYPATGQCIQWVIAAILRLYSGRTLVNGVPVAEGVRFVLSVPGNERVELALTGDEDSCESLPPDAIGDGIDRRAISGSDDDKFKDGPVETSMTTSGILSASLPLGGGTTKIGLSFTRSATIAFSLTTLLARHARYVRVPIHDSFGQEEVCWITEH